MFKDIKTNKILPIAIGLLSLVALSQQFQLGLRLRRSQGAAATNQTGNRLKMPGWLSPRTSVPPATSTPATPVSSSTSKRPSFLAQAPLGGHLAEVQKQQTAANVSARSQHLDDISHRLEQTSGQNASVQQELDTRIPFWNIAHMINSVEQVELALSAGSNGIETDVSFDSKGLPVEAYHGFPCDCGRHCHHREQFVKFVRYLAKITIPPASSRLQVVLFDLKLKDLKSDTQKEVAGRALAEILHKALYEPYQQATRIKSGRALEQNPFVQPPLRVVVSINHATDIALVRAFLKYVRDHQLDFMHQQVGFDVGMNDPLEEIGFAWNTLNGATFNIWQGDGLTNCANIVRGVERLKQAINIRNGQGHFRKVYYWTADVMYHIRSVLRLGIDAVLTNQPQRVNQVLNEEEFRNKFRLATPWDNPFEQFWIRASASKLKPPTFGETVETLANIQKTSQNFIKTIPDGITAAVKKVHHTVEHTVGRSAAK